MKCLTSNDFRDKVSDWWFVVVTCPVILWVIGNAYQS